MKTTRNSSFLTLAPWIYSAGVGGSPVLTKLAASKLSTLLSIDVNGDEDSILGALSSISTHDELVRLRTADNELKEMLSSLGFSTIKSLSIKDDKSSRYTLKEVFPQVLTILLFVSFVLVLLSFLVFKVEVDAGLRDALMILLGTLSSSFTNSLNYFLGTSSSSQTKDYTIQKVIDKK